MMMASSSGGGGSSSLYQFTCTYLQRDLERHHGEKSQQSAGSLLLGREARENIRDGHPLALAQVVLRLAHKVDSAGSATRKGDLASRSSKLAHLAGFGSRTDDIAAQSRG